ncbi:FadR/GntR family transcriptional regulator [Microbispora bryophytorum]|uniref:GntR family transcriptional regulator n=1 Tax=Microbispora bryophytorum TaxID=1460882 RepID=A0A8H9LGB1_9ACTN|nr:FCD domain-containing protein [Microbispora bryophytorum]MBD3140338.1 FadR family transcriptional regulator [Microbispora bryophytorum]TQS02052.1 FadR family transcriptional regulator [Microbispora bryophytorum]GGO26419.1 GntR family transcriptional regulator [Microbispora bryophytorum]
MSEIFEAPLLNELQRDSTDPLAGPIVVRNAPEQIVERLVTAVALGVYVPGQALPPERELASLLGVSRATVREALRRMTDSGYIEQRRGRNGGSFVLEDWRPSSADLIRRHLLPNWTRFEALFDTRQLLEPVIAATAALRRNDDDVAALSQALDDYHAATDREESRVADERVHRAVAESTHNPVLVGLSAQIRTRISLDLGAEPYTPEIRRVAAVQHGLLADAVIDQDSERASAIALEHFGLTEKLVRDLVARVRDLAILETDE